MESLMYTRITTGRYDSSRSREVQELVASKVLEVARTLPGFRSYNGALDRNGNRVAAVTTWDTEEQARGFRDQLGTEIMDEIRNLGVQLDEAQIYETVIDA
jgi:hypothetical protein